MQRASKQEMQREGNSWKNRKFSHQKEVNHSACIKSFFFKITVTVLQIHQLSKPQYSNDLRR